MTSKRKLFFIALTCTIVLVLIAFVLVHNSYYAMGGEVLITAKEQNHSCFITIEQGTPADAGWGQFTLECTKEQYDSVEVGDIVNCERDQSILTHNGIVHNIL